MKNGLIILIALLALTACTSENMVQEVQNMQEKSVGFGVYTLRYETRGEAPKEVTKAIPDGKSFGVYAYYHQNSTWADNAATATPNFMYNQKVTHVASEEMYDYSPLKYWPNTENDKVSFMAYFPYTNTESPENPESPVNTGLKPLLGSSEAGLPTFDFTVADAAENQVDLLVSDLIADLPQSRDTEGDPGTPFHDLSIYDKVKFVFHHALAKVEFRIVADAEIVADIASFRLTSLSISNLYKDGHLTPTYTAGTGVTTLTWSNQSTVKDAYAFSTYKPQLLMPQTLSNSTMLNLNYSITFKSDGTTYHYEGSTLKTDDTYTYNNAPSIQLNTMKLTGSGEALTVWLPNHHYIYTIRLRANRIDFEGEVVNWGDTHETSGVTIEE